MTEKNRFITIEGGDGAGKSTFIGVIKEYLEKLGHEVVLTREPGGTTLGERIRELVLNEEMSLSTETMLMFAARAEGLDKIVKPALSEGKWVICDRFTDSTQAYQCSAKGYPEGKLRALESVVQDELKPGITFVFDVPLHVSKARLAKTGKTPDKFEGQNDNFKELVNQGYKNIVKQNPNRCKLIDSSQTIQDTADQVLIHLEKYVNDVENVNRKKNKP